MREQIGLCMIIFYTPNGNDKMRESEYAGENSTSTGAKFYIDFSAFLKQIRWDVRKKSDGFEY